VKQPLDQKAARQFPIKSTISAHLGHSKPFASYPKAVTGQLAAKQGKKYAFMLQLVAQPIRSRPSPHAHSIILQPR